ncbi:MULTISPECIES: LysR family transcriptional regulator [unclassified Bosea (in: a-proteobacteria)]|uniref:LysR family transcriptional regulator n=1 Tax=unclassified Bosea (in: a-proteobacteria) TaxID=2653178 RepID=UPI000F75F877|nr:MULTISPECIES: LysR family transcriptional regulator [unclassified Bosea (in: a-proteobacteria)]AZO79692.1 LysR family transcriptional regulator [Bosea sp. Tri-49]RXT16055.1 LysR family transcriptional regulator [Bosea sp. Tri-39]RXT39748.1 LysR family transcriptional regulator [Bosea sp. Tri-54]
MAQPNFNDLAAFAMVAKERSFTKAGAKLGVSQSALSQTIKALEERLKLRLLTRTTRSVAPTEAGVRLLEAVAPRFDEIEAEIAALGELRGKPAGTVRITAGEHAAISALQPALRRFLPDHPDIKVEIIVDYGLVDIVAAGYDAGVRLGEQVAKDMIAVRIGPEMRMAVVGSPAYFKRYGLPETPQDLTSHNCIASRLPTYGGLFPWGLEKDGREVKVRGEGQLVFNSLALRLNSALDGLGLAYLPEDQAIPHARAGRLIRVLEDWCPPFPGYHLYYPSRRHFSPALSVLVDVLRYRA